jgi:pimeloyl-ACP methyl ester carboxylesterase
MPRRSFVLIAGSWHGAWCWQKIVPLLEALGHSVRTPDLPGTGADKSDPAGATLEGWARFVAERIAMESEPVILVGHSRAGVVISRTAELVPEHLARLVYLSAYLLTPGGTVAAAARADSESLVPDNMIPATSGTTCVLREDVVREALFGECADADVEFALAHLAPEPLKPLVTPLRVTAERFGRVPRAYVECSRDRTISLAAQRRMQAALPCDPVFTLDTDHSPFLSCPQALAKLLGNL